MPETGEVSDDLIAELAKVSSQQDASQAAGADAAGDGKSDLATQ